MGESGVVQDTFSMYNLLDSNVPITENIIQVAWLKPVKDLLVPYVASTDGSEGSEPSPDTCEVPDSRNWSPFPESTYFIACRNYTWPNTSMNNNSAFKKRNPT